MTTLKSARMMTCALLVLCFALLASAAGRSAEPAQRFLDVLRERGYYDTALEYLDRMASSPLAPKEFQKKLLYEKGVTLIDRSQSEISDAVREEAWDGAQAALRRFLNERADHSLAGAARNRLGNLLIERAKWEVERANSDSQPAEQRMVEARRLYDQAEQLFLASQQQLRDQLAALPKSVPLYDTELESKQQQLRAAYLQTQLLAAAVLEEKADASPEGSPARLDLLNRAAASYGRFYEKYGKRLASLYARMYQGRVRQKAGKLDDAGACYDDVLATEDESDEVRTLKTKTLQLAIQCLLQPSQKKSAEAIRRGAAWLDQVRPHESEEPEWMALRLSLAEAYEQRAEEIRQRSPTDRNVRAARDEARKLASFVSQHPGPQQEEGRRRLAQLGGRPDVRQQRPDPETFDQAKEAGRDALDAMKTAELILQMVPPRLEQETDENIRRELQQQIDEARRKAATSRAEALELLDRARLLAPPGAPSEELNEIRHYLAYLHYVLRDYYDAAVLGEFVARRYGADAAARPCAKIALASYAELYRQGVSGDREFERRRLMSSADLIVRQWPQAPEAQEALNTLIPLTIAAGRLDQSEQYLARIPADSPRRAEAELQTGKALLNAYLRGVRELRAWRESGPPPGVDVAGRKAMLVDVEKRAEKTLSDGIARMRKSGGKAADDIAAASLSLAQIYVDTQQPDKAVSLLEDPQIGVLKLVREKDPSTTRPGFALETYKTALRAYISSLESAKESAAVVSKAKQIMAELRKEAGATPEGQETLIRIYYSLALDLKRQLELAKSAKARDALSQGVETFLEQVGQNSKELNVIYWVAETFAGMGDQYPAVQGRLPSAARKYYEKALAAYQRILELGESLKNWLSPSMKTQVRIRLAAMQRRLGAYKEAIDRFQQILLDNNMLLPAQIEAAQTYQDWAARGEPALYQRAIKGGRINPQTNRNTIWGWGRIARLTAGQDKYRSAFHEARYSLALCRYRYALHQNDETEQKKMLATAERDIVVTAMLYRGLGGEEWEPKYNTLLKAIQKKLGKEATGVEGIKQEAGKPRSGAAP